MSLEEQAIIVSNIPHGTSEDRITIHFQKRSNGGGDVNHVIYPLDQPDSAMVIFNDKDVIPIVLKHKQVMKRNILEVEEVQPQVFDAVFATISPEVLKQFDEDDFEVLMTSLREKLLLTFSCVDSEARRVQLTGNLYQLNAAHRLIKDMWMDRKGAASELMGNRTETTFGTTWQDQNDWPQQHQGDRVSSESDLRTRVAGNIRGELWQGGKDRGNYGKETEKELIDESALESMAGVEGRQNTFPTLPPLRYSGQTLLDELASFGSGADLGMTSATVLEHRQGPTTPDPKLAVGYGRQTPSHPAARTQSYLTNPFNVPNALWEKVAQQKMPQLNAVLETFPASLYNIHCGPTTSLFLEVKDPNSVDAAQHFLKNFFADCGQKFQEMESAKSQFGGETMAGSSSSYEMRSTNTRFSPLSNGRQSQEPKTGSEEDGYGGHQMSWKGGNHDGSAFSESAIKDKSQLSPHRPKQEANMKHTNLAFRQEKIGRPPFDRLDNQTVGVFYQDCQEKTSMPPGGKMDNHTPVNDQDCQEKTSMPPGGKMDNHTSVNDQDCQKTSMPPGGKSINHTIDGQDEHGRNCSDNVTQGSGSQYGITSEAMTLDSNVTDYIFAIRCKDIDILQDTLEVKTKREYNQYIDQDLLSLTIEGSSKEKCNEAQEKILILYKRCFKSIIVENINILDLEIKVDGKTVTLVITHTAKKYPKVFIKNCPPNRICIIGPKEKALDAKNFLLGELGVDATPDHDRHRQNKEMTRESDKNITGIKGQGHAGFSLTTLEGVKVTLIHGDITRLKVDGIVNAANGRLVHGGGVAKAISVAAGPDLAKECRRVMNNLNGRELPVGGVIETTAGYLPCSQVLHAVGPRWADYRDKEECREHLRRTFLNCFLLASEKLSMTSLALPAISSGIFGVPLEIVFQVMYESVLEFSWKYSNRGILKTIQYVNNDEEIYQEMCAFFEKSHQSNPLGVTGVSAERRGLFLKPERESPIVMGESLEAIGESSQAINQQKGEFPKEKENSSKVQRESSKEKANKSENKNEISQVVDKIKEGMAKPVNAIVKVHRSCAKRRKSGRKGGPPASDRSRGEGAMEESAHRRDHTNTREDASEEMEVDEDSMVTQSEKETLENTEDDTMEGASHDTGTTSAAANDDDHKTSPAETSERREHDSHLDHEQTAAALQIYGSNNEDKDDGDDETGARAELNGEHSSSHFYQVQKKLENDAKRSRSQVGHRLGANFNNLSANSQDDASDGKQSSRWTKDGGGNAKSDKREKEESRTSEVDESSEKDGGKTSERDESENCPICMDPIEERKILEKCGHVFCRTCVNEWFLHHKKSCPICGKIYGVITGNQPANGTMTDHVDPMLSLPGFPERGAIVINYNIPSGIQTSSHPHPGKRYSGTSREAYLPNNREGHKVLQLLRKAFEAQLIFTVGTSSTTGLTDQVTWNDIHHKTSTHGGPTGFGYPDDTYLSRVQEELAAKGIK